MLALSSFSVGCKSKKSGGTDAGTDSGATGGTGGSGGSSGKGGGSGGSAGGGGSSGLTAAQCESMTTAVGVSSTCATCGCTKNLAAASACIKEPNCWKLILCATTKCPGKTSDVTCLSTNCADSLTAGAATATPFGMTLSGMCATECPPPTAGTDAGTDAGH
ncbi:MAG: hypothetical protein ACHQ53_13290 [Polyangiales bacterium]